MLLIGYCLGNLLSPQMWLASYAPRYYIPWGIILATYVLCPLMMVSLTLSFFGTTSDEFAVGYRLFPS